VRILIISRMAFFSLIAAALFPANAFSLQKVPGGTGGAASSQSCSCVSGTGNCRLYLRRTADGLKDRCLPSGEEGETACTGTCKMVGNNDVIMRKTPDGKISPKLDGLKLAPEN
jgi:hypothetical protein